MHTDSLTPHCKDLFLGFLKLGLMGFGGVLPIARHILVDEKKWLTEAEFLDLLGVCQILPGGNILNMSVAMGMRFAGGRGAFCALTGLIFAPTIIVILIYLFYLQFQTIVWVQHLILGLAATAAGLLCATALKLLKPILKEKRTLITIALTFLFMVWFKLPLLLVLVILFAMNVAFLKMSRA